MAEPFLGEIRMFGGNFAPNGWALCDGQLLQVSQNEGLFALLGTIYGGNGRTTFGLPDLRGRVPIDFGQGVGLPNYPIGTKAGSETATVTTAQLPAHNHFGLQVSQNAGNSPTPVGNVPAVAPVNAYGNTATANLNNAAIANTGGGASHNNVMPFLAITFIIALLGVFPSQT